MDPVATVRGWFAGSPEDPQGAVLRRAVRVTVVAVPLFVVLGPVLGIDGAAAPAVLATFTLGSFADFAGPPRRRLVRYLVTGAVAAALMPVAEVTARVSPVLVVAATFVVALLAFFCGVLGGAFYAARFPVLVAFLLTACSAPLGDDLAPLVFGWAVGTVCIAVAAVTLWPAPVRFPVRRLSGAAARLAGRRLQELCAGADTRATDRRLGEVLDRLRSTSREAHLHPGGLARDQRLVAEIAHQVERVVAAIELVDPAAVRSPAPESHIGEARLADAVVDVTTRVDEVLSATPAVAAAADPLPVAALDRAMADQLDAASDLLGSATGHDPGGTGTARSTVAELAAVTPVRAVGSATVVLAELVEAWRTGHAVPRATTLGIRRGDDPVTTLRTHLALRSLWLRNAIRAGVALSVAMAAVQVGLGAGHGFWIVLGTYSVLRADAATIRRSARASLVGGAVGFVVAVVVVVATEAVTPLGWVLFPVALFIACWSGRFRPEVASASFTVYVVLLFTLVQPEGPTIAGTRLVNVAIGAGIAIVVGTLLWPRVGTVPEGSLADLVERAAGFLRARSAAVTGTGPAVDGASPVPPPGDPMALLTELDRVLDMLATSAPASVPTGVREPLIATVDAAVGTVALLAGESERMGMVTAGDLQAFATDPEAATALDADTSRSVERLEALAGGIRHHRRPRSAHDGDGGPAGPLLDLAGRRLAGAVDPS
ncbi:MAG: FUSC family protein, partial [Microthrixaceae bacterium]